MTSVPILLLPLASSVAVDSPHYSSLCLVSLDGERR